MIAAFVQKMCWLLCFCLHLIILCGRAIGCSSLLVQVQGHKIKWQKISSSSSMRCLFFFFWNNWEYRDSRLFPNCPAPVEAVILASDIHTVACLHPIPFFSRALLFTCMHHRFRHLPLCMLLYCTSILLLILLLLLPRPASSLHAILHGFVCACKHPSIHVCMKTPSLSCAQLVSHILVYLWAVRSLIKTLSQMGGDTSE